MSDAIRLVVPAQSRHVRLVRLTAAGVAADAGLDVDDVEDVRVAVSELFALLVDDAESEADEVEVRYQANDDGIEITGRRAVSAPTSDSAEPPVPDDLALDILRVIVDEHRFDSDNDERRFELVKRRRSEHPV
jgi:serine/threonine-protein kinase RsbW